MTSLKVIFISILILQIEIGREDPPHGDCENVNDEQNQLKNLWRSQFDWLDYTLEG